MSHKRVLRNAAFTGGNAGKQHLLRVLALALTIIWMLGPGLTFTAAQGRADRKTIVTFNTPVEIPGKALPAGTYVFRLLDDMGTRDIIQVFDKDEKQLLATLVAIPDYRQTPPDKPIINFEQRGSDTPPAIKAVYFPGDTYGLQFVYPQNRAVQLAKGTHQNVLSMPNDMKQNMATQARSANDPSVQQLEKTDVTGVDASGAPVNVVIIVGSAPQK
jgi:hypothetical protein